MEQLSSLFLDLQHECGVSTTSVKYKICLLVQLLNFHLLNPSIRTRIVSPVESQVVHVRSLFVSPGAEACILTYVVHSEDADDVVSVGRALIRGT